MNKSNKNKTVALLLCIFLGYLGVHRFYVGKNKSGILYLFTLGLFGIGWIYDTIQLSTNKFTDVHGKVLTDISKPNNNYQTNTLTHNINSTQPSTLSKNTTFQGNLLQWQNVILKDKTEQLIMTKEQLEDATQQRAENDIRIINDCRRILRNCWEIS